MRNPITRAGLVLSCLIPLLLPSVSGPAWATSINSVNRHAYGANVGWLNFRGDITNGAKIGLYFSTGHVWSANAGWINLGSGTPTNGYSYANNSATDWGVNLVLPGGHLRGLAGTNPLDGSSLLEITALNRTVTTNAVTWTVDPTRTYRLEQASVADNNAVWSDSGLGDLPPGAGPTLTGLVPDPAATTRFYRSTALVPLAP